MGRRLPPTGKRGSRASSLKILLATRLPEGVRLYLRNERSLLKETRPARLRTERW